jgi:hypothetical protein
MSPRPAAALLPPGAGPKVLILADDSADPVLLALDLLAQAEHGADSAATLVTWSEALAESVAAAVAPRLAALPRAQREFASATIADLGGILICADEAEASLGSLEAFASTVSTDLVLSLALFATMLGNGVVIPFMPLYAQQFGAHGAAVGLLFGAQSAARTLLLPVIGRASDRHGRKAFLATVPTIAFLGSSGSNWEVAGSCRDVGFGPRTGRSSPAIPTCSLVVAVDI